MGGCMGQWVGSGQMTNLIKLELINIIWFCLKIYNLSRHPYLWVDGWVNGWAHVKPLKSNKSWPNWDNSIMDILDILLDILLKPPQPFIGLFFLISDLIFRWQQETNQKSHCLNLLAVYYCVSIFQFIFSLPTYSPTKGNLTYSYLYLFLSRLFMCYFQRGSGACPYH